MYFLPPSVISADLQLLGQFMKDGDKNLEEAEAAAIAAPGENGKLTSSILYEDAWSKDRRKERAAASSGYDKCSTSFNI